MRISKKSIHIQRAILDRKVKSWLPLRSDRMPPAGWIKAIRGALGLTTRQLAERMGSHQSAILQFEKAEVEGRITLESIQKVAQAMRCRLIYAIVPEESLDTLDSILDEQAIQAARAVVTAVDHSMELERQGLSSKQSEQQVLELAKQLKSEMDSSLWKPGSK